MIASSGFASPLAIPLLVGGLALVGASGLFGGILGGLQKKYDAKNEKKAEIPNVNQSTSGSTNGQRALGPGASSLSADKSVFQPVINITIDNSIDGISNLIVKRIQAENELNK